jgi:hypothetical protein
MRLSRMRMTLRRWMIAVAAASVGLGIWEIERRRDRYRQRAYGWQREELLAWDNLIEASHPEQVCVRGGKGASETQDLPINTERLRQQTLYCQRMKRKYEYAARHPWLPVEPDPPRPQMAPSLIFPPESSAAQ